jgi:hypothetical protein
LTGLQGAVLVLAFGVVGVAGIGLEERMERKEWCECE